MAFVLFTAVAVASTLIWNRRYRRIPVSIAILFWLIVSGYLAPTLFSSKVDVPGALAHHAYPWKALGRRPAIANTGIVFTQLVPWTEAARRSIRAGELPFWNRDSASGSPLWANQQTALLHPFTLIGLPLSIGKAFTLSAALRLFFVLFFTYLFLRRWDVSVAAALYGAVAYAFCTFHIVWLLFPLGLATMMLPLVLAGIDELVGRQDPIAAVPLVCGVAGALLGGHPESAAWVFVLGGAYALFCTRRLAWIAGAAVIGVALSAVWWYPTWRILPYTSRTEVLEAMRASPPHRFGAEWFLPLIRPNILGTPQAGTYHPPQPKNAGVLDDYGEVASGYSGGISILFAIVALARIRRGPRLFLALAAAFALLTIAEVPGWRSVIAHTPLIGITLVGRLRFVIAWSVAMLAAFGIDDWLRGARPKLVLTATTLAELLFITRGYNPPSKPKDVLPVTGAIRFLQQQPRPFRFAAIGWSFLAETPSFYGIEDIKTTDPIATPSYLRFINAFAEPGDYDQVIRDPGHPFLDVLGVRHVYVPPDQHVGVAWWREVYRGPDGAVFENTRAVPRYHTDHDGEVAILAYRNNSTTLHVRSKERNLLVSSDVAWPGWHARWNGREVPVVNAGRIFVGLYVPAGEGELRLSYRPPGFIEGALASSATAMLLLFFLVRALRASGS